ncbi:ABC transporter permease [Rathayibacter sp. YIM 133350]|uniref:ABC transporter permease n=1 Tax=Rathayibacter sp. YIM 133350 TaxID=3131992 RepID=UPI00307FAE64
MSIAQPSTTDAARAIAAAARPRRFGAWYVALHRLRVMRSYGGTILASSIGSPIIYLYVLGVGLAGLIDANLGDESIDGVGYLVFVAPALLASAAITAAAEEFTYPVMVGYKWNPTFSGIASSPIRPPQIVGGLVISVALRMALTCVLYFLLMLAFGAVPSPTGVLMLPAVVLTGMAFGAVLMAYSSTIEEDTGQLSIVMRVVVLPMTLFSGTFFPLAQLPLAVQWIGWISPLWHGAQLARIASFGYSEPLWLTLVHVLYLLGMLAAGWIISRRIAARRLNS